VKAAMQHNLLFILPFQFKITSPMRFTFSSVLLLSLIVITTSSFYVKPTFNIVIDKSDYEMSVFDEEGKWVVTYPVVFGNKDQGDKLMEGDRRTPEGSFYIINKRVHEKWCRFMMLDYPNKDSYQKFNERKSKGIIPQSAKIGGSIGIHGTWPHEDFAVDRYQNWTQGCISTKNEYIIELYNMIPSGTKVTIRK
jgi:murein L,D-transpeptidase YafK